jgi:hypothetical protein
MSLERLDLSYNNVPSKAAFVIAHALHINDTIAYVRLDGNPLGTMPVDMSFLQDTVSA